MENAIYFVDARIISVQFSFIYKLQIKFHDGVKNDLRLLHVNLILPWIALKTSALQIDTLVINNSIND